MTRNTMHRPRPCSIAGHDWSGYGPFIPVASPPFSISPNLANEPPKIEPLVAFRYRKCYECGAEEKEPF